MDGVGSVLKPCRTLFVGAIACRKYADPRACEAALWRGFGEWGEVENVNLISRLSIAFVRFRSRAGAEFAKEAMANQTLEHGVRTSCASAYFAFCALQKNSLFIRGEGRRRWSRRCQRERENFVESQLQSENAFGRLMSFYPLPVSHACTAFFVAAVNIVSTFDEPHFNDPHQEVLNVRWAYDDPNPVALEAAERADADAVVNMMNMRGVALAPGASGSNSTGSAGGGSVGGGAGAGSDAASPSGLEPGQAAVAPPSRVVEVSTIEDYIKHT